MVDGRWQRLGETEIIHDCPNPQFVKKIAAQYHFERQELFKVEVYDSDDDAAGVRDLSRQELIGGLEFQLHTLVNQPNLTMYGNLQSD